MKKSRGVKGEANRMSRLSERQVRFIRASDLSGPVLAERMGVSRVTVFNIRHRRTWTHIE